MSLNEERIPVVIGDVAPGFSLPAIHRDGEIGLGEYKGRSAVLLGMLRGLYCSFCRRQMAQLDSISEDLAALGVDLLVVITTPVERARIYAEFYPTRLPLAADPKMTIHRAFGLPRPLEISEGPTDWPHAVNPADIETVEVSTRGELKEPITLGAAVREFDAIDGFEKSEEDLRDLDNGWTQLSGLVLIDKGGIVRWFDIEAPNSFTEFGQVASNPEILAAARDLANAAAAE